MSIRIAICSLFWLLLALSGAAPAREAVPSLEQVQSAFDRGDYEQAMRGALLRSEGDDRRVLYLLGWMYREGLGTVRNAQRAYSYFVSAAEHGDARGWHGAGTMCRDGEFVTRNPERACDYFARAAAERVPAAQLDFARCLLSGNGRPRDDSAARAWLHRAGAQDQMPALLELLRLAERGVNLAAKPSSAADNGRRALAAGDTAQALRFGRSAAEAGDAAGHGIIGAVLLARADAANQDLAMLHLRVAVAADDPFARYRLALASYRQQQTDILTRHFCDEMQGAHDGGIRAAAAWLGECWRRGEGDRERNPETARDLFIAAAQEEVTEAYAGLARLYVAGEGVERDPVVAARWAARALAEGVQNLDAETYFGGFEWVELLRPIKGLARSPGAAATEGRALPAGSRLRLLRLEPTAAQVYSPEQHSLGWVSRDTLRTSLGLALGTRFAALNRADVRAEMASRAEYAPLRFSAGQDIYQPLPGHSGPSLTADYRPDGSVATLRLSHPETIVPSAWEQRHTELQILHGAAQAGAEAATALERVAHWKLSGHRLELRLDRINAVLIEQYQRGVVSGE